MAESDKPSPNTSQVQLPIKISHSQTNLETATSQDVIPDVPEEPSGADGEPPTSVTRSHTPGQLATHNAPPSEPPPLQRSSDIALRQRAQAASQGPPRPATSSGIKKPVEVPPPAPPIPPAPPLPAAPSAPLSVPLPAPPAITPTAAGSKDDTSDQKRVVAAAAVAAAAAAATGAAPSRSALKPTRPPPPAITRPPEGKHIPFPPIHNPDEAPDVPQAPPSGMYWSSAPVSGYPHANLRAHTTTLVGSNVYIFGGCDAKTCFNSMYVLDADAFYWSVPHMVGEIPTPLRAMTCTAVGKKLVVFGGGDGPAYYNDVYVLDTVNFRWSRPRIVGDKLPSKRRAHTACLYKNGIFIFGGGDGVRALNDIWRLDVSDITKMSWKLISSSEKSGSRERRPKARGYHTANMVGGKLIIYGGSDGGECFDDVWIYDVDKHVWKAVHIPLTFRRLSHTATIVGSYLFVIGGHDGNEYCNDVLLLNLVTMTWDKRRVYGVPPSGRGYHGTVLYDSRLLMIGGFDGTEVFGDVMILELAVHSYYSQISHFTIDV